MDTLPMSSEESDALGSMMGSTWKAQKNEERIKLTPGESCLILDPSLLYYHNACLVKACLRRNYPVIIFPPEDGHSLVPQHQVEAHVICQYFQETHANTHTNTFMLFYVPASKKVRKHGNDPHFFLCFEFLGGTAG